MTARPFLPTDPPVWLRLLSRLLPYRHREPFLGDLMEEYETFIRPGRSPRAARAWLRRQAFKAALTGSAYRIHDAARRWGHALGVTGRRGSDHRGRDPMDILGQDLRYAVRRLFASPGFTAVAVLSLSLGIGANTALFTLVNTLMLEGVGVEDPSTLVEIYTGDDNGYPYTTSSYPDYYDLRAQGTAVFQDVVSHEMTFAQTEVDGGEPMLTLGEIVSANYFDVLGIHPVLGRSFSSEEDRTPGTHPVVVIGYDFWQRVFGGDPAVVGRSLRIIRRPYTVIGVAPEGFGGLWPGVMCDIYVPAMMANQISLSPALDRRDYRSLFLKGRLRPGVSPEQAAEWVSTFSRGLAEAYPETNEGHVMTALPSEDVSLHPFVDRALVPIAALLFAVVGLVLLIACTNLASFLLARAEDRRKEIAVRLALGARRRTLVRQLLTETVLLALLGGAFGLLLARWTLSLILGFRPPIPLPLSLNMSLDGTVFLFTLCVAVAVGLVFGLIPALQSTNPDVAPTLRDESGGGTGGRRRWSLRNGLVIVQVGLSFVLLIGAGLFVRSLQKAQAIDPGFDTGAAAMVWPNLEMSLIDDEDGPAVWDELMDRARAIPGVERVALLDRMPLGIGVRTSNMLPEGKTPPAGQDGYDVDFATIDENYSDVLGVPVVRGRGFDVTDTDDTEAVALVSEAFVRTFWPGEDGLNKTLERRGTKYRVVGVAKDAKVRTLGEQPRPMAYFSRRQSYSPVMYILVRGSLPEAELLGQLQSAMRDASPDLVIMDASTMSSHLVLPFYAPRMAAILLGVFGGLALILSGIGLYGVVSYAVARRTREVGIRMSVGADPGSVVRMVVGGGLRLVLIGGVLGMALSAAVTWLLSRFLYGVSTLDVATFVSIPLLLTAVAALAAFVPARRASRVNPVEALRTE